MTSAAIVTNATKKETAQREVTTSSHRLAESVDRNPVVAAVVVAEMVAVVDPTVKRLKRMRSTFPPWN